MHKQWRLPKNNLTSGNSDEEIKFINLEMIEYRFLLLKQCSEIWNKIENL
jgi:hypothetical protein